MTIFNLFSWTHGLALMTGEFSLHQIKNGLFTPVIFGTCAGIILFFARIRLPEIILDGLGYVADMNTPLAMMIAGLSIAQVDFQKMFLKVHLYWVSCIKLLCFPALIMLIFSLLPLDRTVAYTSLIAAACPTATTVNMMAIRYNQDYKYCSEMFAFTTVLAVVTIPVIILLAEHLI